MLASSVKEGTYICKKHPAERPGVFCFKIQRTEAQFEQRINAEEKQELRSTSSSAVPDASVKVANLRACYTFISFALWLETHSHRVHSVFRFSLCRIFLSPAVWNAEPQVYIIAWIRASPCFTKGECTIALHLNWLTQIRHLN